MKRQIYNPSPGAPVTRHLPENQIQFECSLHQQKLEQVQPAKYLRITITDNLDWGQYVSEISCRATKTMSSLWRNLSLAPRHTKEVTYKTLVPHQLEYAAPIRKFRLNRLRRCRGQLPDGHAGDGEMQVASAICWTNLSGHPWRPVGRSLP